MNKRAPFVPDPSQMTLWPEISGNVINGLGERTKRRPSPVYWHEPDTIPHWPLQGWFAEKYVNSTEVVAARERRRLHSGHGSWIRRPPGHVHGRGVRQWQLFPSRARTGSRPDHRRARGVLCQRVRRYTTDGPSAGGVGAQVLLRIASPVSTGAHNIQQPTCPILSRITTKSCRRPVEGIRLSTCPPQAGKRIQTRLDLFLVLPKFFW